MLHLHHTIAPVPRRILYTCGACGTALPFTSAGPCRCRETPRPWRRRHGRSIACALSAALGGLLVTTILLALR